MEHTHCPTCGRKFTTKRTPAAVTTAEMTDTELYAHFKKTSVPRDLAFFLRDRPAEWLSPSLRAHAAAISRPTRADITRLNTLWRIERRAYEIAHGIPSIGSPAWWEALNAENESEAA